MSTIFDIKQQLNTQAGVVAEMLLPKGHRRGNDWIIGNTRGEAGQSLSVCLSGSKAGLWYDFAEGKGGDLLDLWCEVKGLSLSQALEEARAFLNLTRPKPFMAPHRSYRRPPAPPCGTPENLVKTYLNKERGIPLEILKRYRIGEDGEKIIFPFYKPDGTLALVKERLAQAGAKTKPTAAQCEAILFGWQALYPIDNTPHKDSQNHPSPTNTQNSHPSPINLSPPIPVLEGTTISITSLNNSTDMQESHIPTNNTSRTNHTLKTEIHRQSLTSSTTGDTVSTNHTLYKGSQNPNPPADTQSFHHSPISLSTSTNVQEDTHHTTTSSSLTKHTSTTRAATCAPDNALTSDSLSLNQAFSSSHGSANQTTTNRILVITEGEIDALSLAAYGYPAVSVPFGGGSGGKQNWIENEFDHLESFETIFLATDMDKPGEEAAHEIASRLGRHRCYRVRLPRKDANDCLTAGIDAATIRAAFAAAKSFAPEGLRHASDYKEQVIGLFWPEPEQHIGYTLPYPKLNGKLHFRPAELTLWSGASGAGKSQLLSDCIPHWISQNSRLCLASLEMKGAQSLRRLTKQTGGLEQPTREMIERVLQFLDDGLILYEHVGKSNVDTLLNVFDYCRARYGCDQFIIDSLMRLGIASDDYAGQEQAVYKMVDWAVLNNVHIHLVAHARKGGLDKDIPGTEDIKGASEIGANAFNIITIWRNRSLEDKIFAASLTQEKADLEKRPSVIMNIAKQRSGDFEGKIGLWFDKKTYRYRCSCEHHATPRRYLERPIKPTLLKNASPTTRAHLAP
ncbi:toprim domain-containing protein [Bartonella sp. ML70XJBT.G]|uniref:toprim domain-containing protein n=1 Tax=Bartonella sp. ML70XJBT.G TaxID=3019093 RepID=UPI00235FC2F1|nr:toprim domain-containing protein [Bartonella sp. ML70XJBT.G]